MIPQLHDEQEFNRGKSDRAQASAGIPRDADWTIRFLSMFLAIKIPFEHRFVVGHRN
jgi:hypothetical protein